MKSYLITLMAVALLNGLVGMISPEGDVKKYVRLLGSLCLLCAMAQPVLGWLSEGDGLIKNLWELETEEESTNYDEIYNQALLSGGEKNAESIIKNNLLEAFELPSGSVDVRVDMEMKNDTCEILEVQLTIREEAIFADPRELISYVNERFSCPCVVVYD